MSATFKNAKKKLLQAEFRKFMDEHKSKAKDVKRIESPLAKYNDCGELTCILCQSIVRSETVWTVHINSKQHKENIEQARKLKKRTNNFTTPAKRPISPPVPQVPDKKIKGILRNTKTNTNSSENPETVGRSVDSKFPPKQIKQEQVVIEATSETKEVLPEGFFDDPKLDAKARNREYKDPVEEEWEKFMKVIKDADNESNAIISEDQEEATTERQIDEIEEQLKKLSRVLDFEKKKEEIKVASDTRNAGDNDDEDDEGLDVFDEFLDWRTKKSFK
ncbi:unnamed protein product [Acanthoscelides obtectus]|uniref:Zinc finger protein 830 n=1 Tax=Acanthoscelides obtectus TaxID=200917 RepID=A0A9P0PCA5_ACAOB|nr:unnamed protein product [Acanthoscelides obtectus]CAK1655796.1 Zinc finger protein 830 [Acanthoscelides obtectus]